MAARSKRGGGLSERGLALVGDPVDPRMRRRELRLFSLDLHHFHVALRIELAEEVQVIGELLLDFTLG